MQDVEDLKDLNDVLQALRSKMSGSAPPRTNSLVQKMELLSLHKAAKSEPSDLKPGELCLEKTGFASTKDGETRGHLVYMIWDMIGMDNPFHKQIVKDWCADLRISPDVDCIVATIPTPGHVFYRPHARCELRRLTAEEMEGVDE